MGLERELSDIIVCLDRLNISVDQLKNSRKTGKLEIGHLYSNTHWQNWAEKSENNVKITGIFDKKDSNNKLQKSQNVKPSDKDLVKKIDSKLSEGTISWNSANSDLHLQLDLLPSIKLSYCEDIKIPTSPQPFYVSPPPDM